MPPSSLPLAPANQFQTPAPVQSSQTTGPGATVRPASVSPTVTAPAPQPGLGQDFMQNLNPGSIPVAQAQSTPQMPQAAASPISEGPEPQEYTLNAKTIQGWIDNGASPAEAHSAAMAVDSSYAAGVQKLSDFASKNGQPNGNDPTFVARALKGWYNIGQTQKANPDMGALMAALQKMNTAPPPPTDTTTQTPPATGLAADFQNRVQGVSDAVQRLISGKQGIGETMLQGAGEAAGGINDAIGEGVGAVAKGLWHIAPEAIKQPLGAAAKSFVESPIVQAGLQAVSAGKNVYDQWKQSNPAQAADLESVVNIGMILPEGAAAESVAEDAAKGGASLLYKTGLPDVANSARSAVGNLADKALGVDSEKIAANEAYQTAASKAKTTLDLAQPKLTGDAIDKAAEDSILAEDGKGNVTGYSGSTPKQKEISSELSKVPGINPDKPGASIAATKKQIGSLSDQARQELTMQAKKNPVFQTQKYQGDAIKEVRTALSKSVQTPEVQALFDDSEMGRVQKISNITENKYSEFLKNANGEKEVAKLDLRQWLDKQVSEPSWNKELAELPVATRTYRIFRSAISDSIDEGAKKIGGTYQPIMDRISNLYKGLDSMRTHLPNSQQSLMDQFKIGERELPNAGPQSRKEAVKDLGISAAKKTGKAALSVIGLREALH